MKKGKIIASTLTILLGIMLASNYIEPKCEENSNAIVVTNYNKGYDNYFIIPYSSSIYLSEGDLIGLTLEELEIARNEIYARHGYQFQQKRFIDYFNNQSWYVRSPYVITTDNLSPLEYENVMLIEKVEKRIANGKYNYCNNYYYGNFVIPDSSIRKLSSNELSYLTTWELAVARNEIYARHGYIFVSNEWKNFFVNEYWYTPVAYSVTLNSIEEYNVALILKEEARR